MKIDIVVVATENFPLRNATIFDKMITKLTKHNYDNVIVCKNEKGSIFLNKNNRITKINDGEIPTGMRSQEIFSSRIGIGYVARVSNLRKGNLTSGRSGRYFVDNGLEMTEVTKKSLSKSLKEIIKLNYGQLK